MMDVENCEREQPYQIPADKVYAVVELTHNNRTYSTPVPSLWIENAVIMENKGKFVKKGTCLWPSDETKLSDWIERRKKPDKNKCDWMHHNVKIIKLCGSYSKAKHYAEQYSVVSDMSESDLSFSNKDRRTRMKPTVNSGEDTDAMISSDSDDSHSRPLKLMKLGVHNDESAPAQLPVGNANCEEKTVEINPPELISLSSILGTPDVANEAETGSFQTEANASTSMYVPDQGASKEKGSNKAKRGLFSTPRKSPKKSPLKTLTSHGAVLDYRTFIREITGVRRSIDKLGLKMEKVLTILSPDLQLSRNEDGSGIPTLPLQNEEEEMNWNVFIKDPENAIIVVRLLADHGSKDSRGTVYGVLKKLLSNKVASSYNFKGKNKANAGVSKKAFKDSPSYAIVLAAVRSRSEKQKFYYDVEKINIQIMDWLKDAPKRYRTEQEKSEAATPV